MLVFISKAFLHFHNGVLLSLILICSNSFIKMAEDAVVFETSQYVRAAAFIIEFQGSLWYDESQKYNPIETEDFLIPT